MRLIRPTTIGDATLLSGSIAEDDYPAWSAGSTYALGDRAVKSHRIWESSQAANTGHDPATAGITWWIDIGPTNRWAMFDDKVGTLSRADESLSVTLAPGRIDALALLQVDAAHCTVSMMLGAEEVYHREVSLIDDSLISDWFLYFFEPIRPKDYVLLTNLPIYGESEINIALSKPSGEVSCGMAVLGLQVDLGGTLINPSLGINDYSRKETDTFGNTSLVERSFSKRMGVKLILSNVDVDRVHAALSAVRATPIVWVGSGRFSAMVVYGFFRDFEIDIAYTRHSYCTLNIEGMI